MCNFPSSVFTTALCAVTLHPFHAQNIWASHAVFQTPMASHFQVKRPQREVTPQNGWDSLFIEFMPTMCSNKTCSRSLPTNTRLQRLSAVTLGITYADDLHLNCCEKRKRKETTVSAAVFCTSENTYCRYYPWACTQLLTSAKRGTDFGIFMDVGTHRRPGDTPRFQLWEPVLVL